MSDAKYTVYGTKVPDDIIDGYKKFLEWRTSVVRDRLKEKYKTDPVYRQKMIQRAKNRYHEKKQKKTETPQTE